MNSFKTPKGTVLPIADIKGKDYLQVAFRLVWFREEHPNWQIRTQVNVAADGKSSIARAEILDESGRIIATAHKQEHQQHFNDHIEKAETGSIGRALAMCGYGTQFCADELDEGQRLADSPIAQRCEACNAELKFDPKGNKFYCPNWRDTTKKHTIKEVMKGMQ